MAVLSLSSILVADKQLRCYFGIFVFQRDLIHSCKVHPWPFKNYNDREKKTRDKFISNCRWIFMYLRQFYNLRRDILQLKSLAKYKFTQWNWCKCGACWTKERESAYYKMTNSFLLHPFIEIILRLAIATFDHMMHG